MVVCESGFVASTIASIMMNGVCCLWQMEEEKEKQMQQREAFRRDIRVEYERQRRIEQEIWETRRTAMTENWYNDASSVNTDQRRRKLIATKASLAQCVATEQQQSSTYNDSTDNVSAAQHRQGTAHPLVQRVASPMSRQPIKKRKIRIATSPTNSIKTRFDPPVIMDTCYPKSPQQWNDMSSLMDSAFHDDDDNNDQDDLDQEMMTMMEDEITSLVDVPLR